MYKNIAKVFGFKKGKIIVECDRLAVNQIVVENKIFNNEGDKWQELLIGIAKEDLENNWNNGLNKITKEISLPHLLLMED